MKRTAFAKAAISSLIIGTTMVGCTGAAFRPSSIAKASGTPERLAESAEKALADRDAAAAVRAAEVAVQGAPRDATYRQLLGRAYVASGRFTSAETALSDAMTLGSRDARTIVSLALVKVALGKDAAARELLLANADAIPAGDYGLAMSMAGDASEGVRILSQAIHDPSATAQTRQNLAYAYALAGRWKEARIMAGLDLDPSAANQRITQWAQIAAPAFSAHRIAALMGVTIDAADAGQPTALALAPEIAPMQMAEGPTPAQVVEAAPVGAVLAESVHVADRADAPVPAFATPVSVTAVAEHAAAPVFRKPASVRVPDTPRRVQAVHRFDGRGASNWVVQLGAYENAAIAKEKWYNMAGRNSALSALPVVTSQITLNGATYSRLAVSGFDDHAEAVALCRSIRARQGQCFVRENVPDATPQRWALAQKGRQFASRRQGRPMMEAISRAF